MRYLFIVLFACIIFTSKAQSVKNQQFIGWRYNEDIKIKSFPNKDRSLNCVVLSNTDSIIANVYNAKLDKVYSFRTKNNGSIFKSYYAIGGFFNDSLVNVLLKNKSCDTLKVFTYNIKNELVKQYNTPFNNKGKIYACTINTGDNCYFISAGNRRPFLSIVTMKNEGITKESIFELNKGLNTNLTDNEMLKVILTSDDNLGRLANFAVINDYTETNANKAYFKNKIYFKNDSLIFTNDNNFSETKKYVLNLKNNVCNYEVIKYPFFKKSAISSLYTKSNSTIIENIIYHLAVTSDNLNVTAINLNTKDTLVSYTAVKTENIDFKNTDIKQNGNASSKNITTLQLLKKMANNSAVISGAKNIKGFHEIYIGGYQANNGTTGGALAGGLVGGVVGAVVVSSIMYSTSSHLPNVTSFKSLFDPLTAKHISGEIPESGTDLIDDYTNGVEMPTQGSDTFYYDGNTYFTYYDNKLKSLVTIMLK
ncbi:MAG: hypothetical protein EAZ15_04810 [Sphingobacteriales bacterium]|nr:MAG: hypothetical protein EAZ15_04810 [Sphingobacteriales bacterium]